NSTGTEGCYGTPTTPARAWERGGERRLPSGVAGGPRDEARAGASGRVLGPSVGTIGLGRDAVREGLRVDQFESGVRAVLGEEPRALADDHGVDEEDDLVDQAVVEQTTDQLTAAVHLQFAPLPGLQFADGRRGAAVEH